VSIPAEEQQTERRSAGAKVFSIAWKVIAIAIAIVAIAWLHKVGSGNTWVLSAIERFGYPGIFAVAVVSGFNVVVPIPAISFLPAIVAAGFSATIAVIVISAGMTVGDMVGFVLGRLGRKRVERPEWLQRLERIRERHRLAPYVLLFLNAGFSPLPNEVLVIPIALIGGRWYGVFLAALTGNLIFNVLLGAGFQSIFDLI
jgi:membrane protein YqaA with SNARE-associated domain